MQELDAVLTSATAAIEEPYFRLPIHGGEAKLFERNYCYELYHHLRCAWPPECAFSLNGEVDKRWHPVIGQLADAQSIPDLLVHTPGSMAGNHAIIEVKRARTNADDIRKDFATLTRFMQPDIHYERGIYLIFGGMNRRTIVRAVGQQVYDPRIEVWLHDHVGSPAYRAFAVAELPTIAEA